VTTTTPTRDAIADVCDQAAAHLVRVGHHKGDLTDPGAPQPDEMDCPACLIAAINAVIYGTPRWITFEDADFALRDAVTAALRETLEIPPAASPSALADWNDDPAVSADNVLAALRDTAARLRGEA
jgi:hypothetical protein